MQKRGVEMAKERDKREVELKNLAKSIARWTEESEKYVTAVPGLVFYRHDEPTEPNSAWGRRKARPPGFKTRLISITD